MKIETIGHSDRYSVEQICSMFCSNDSDVYVKSFYDTENDKIVTLIKTEKDEKISEFSICGKEDTDFKNSVKKSAFLAFSKVFKTETPWGVLTGIRPSKFVRNLLSDYSSNEVLKILEDEYWVSNSKAELSLSVARKAMGLLSSLNKNDACLYIGIPFCPTRCAYCSFVSEAYGVYKKYIPEYAKALCKEIASAASDAKNNSLKIKAVYIGGGTPPSLGKELLREIILSVRDAFGIYDGTEFTIEAGRPDVIDDDLLSMLSETGINRICINPQTMNDETLKLIGRRHTEKDTQRAFELSRKYGFKNINSDIIAALPGENNDMFNYTLKRMKTLNPEELTVHTMYLKRASRISKEGTNQSFGDAAKMVNEAYRFASEQGYEPYYMYKQRNTIGNLENTGYAKAGCESIYNVCIMEETHTVLACGAGASNKIVGNNGIKRIYNTKDVLSYIKNIDEIVKNKSEKIKSYLI